MNLFTKFTRYDMIITSVLDDRAQQIRFQLTFPIFPLTSQSDTIDPKKW